MPLSRADIQSLRALAGKKDRLASGKMLIEGARLAAEALQAPGTVERLMVTNAFLAGDEWSRLDGLAGQQGLVPESITAKQAEQLSQTRSPQGIFALLDWPLQAPGKTAVAPPVLVLDAIADPGNLGTLLRTADWFGLPSVYVSADSADITNPKVVRSAMGAHFHLPQLLQGDLMELPRQLADRGVPILGAVLDGEPAAELAPLTEWALVLGSEAHGLSPFWLERLDRRLTVAGGGAAESLNVTVAAGILLHRLREPAG